MGVGARQSSDVLCLRPEVPVGGRLAVFSGNWAGIPTSSLIRSICTKGLSLTFIGTPPVFTGVRRTPLKCDQRKVLLEEIQTMLDKAAIELIPRNISRQGLFDLFPRAKENRRFKTYYISQKAESRVGYTNFQNGVITKHYLSRSRGGVARQSGSERCIFPHTHSSFISQVSPVLCGRQMLSVQGSPVRALNVSPVFHKSPSTCSGHDQTTGDSLSSILGRPVVQGSQSPGVGTSFGTGTENSDPSRVYCKSQEVGSHTYAGSGVYRGQISYEQESGLSSREQEGRNHFCSGILQNGSIKDCKSLAVVSRTGGSVSSSSQVGTSENSSHSAVLHHQMEQPNVSLQQDSGSFSSSGTSNVVDHTRSSVPRFFAVPPRFHACRNNRCIRSWLGGSVRRSQFREGEMEKLSEGLAHKRERVESSGTMSQAVCGGVKELCGLDQVRQHDSVLLPQEDGGYQSTSSVPQSIQPVFVGAVSSDRNKSPLHSGDSQFYGRLSVERSSVSQGSDIDRSSGVVFERSSHSNVVHQVGSSLSGSVCHEQEQEMSGVFFMGRRSQGSAVGCAQHGLDESFRLCIPSKTIDSTCSSQGQEGQLRHDSGLSGVASTSLVHNVVGLVGRSASPSARESAVVVPERNISPQRDSSQLDRLEVIRRSYQDKGISQAAAGTMLASLRKSSHDTYQAKWVQFHSWCTERQINPFYPSLSDVVNFLQFKFEQGMAASTLRGYAAAISPIVGLIDGQSLTSHEFLSKFLQGALNKRPPVHKVVPRWELSVVLCALMEKDFEPPESCPLLLWSWKTLFLLAITSLSRCSELHALDSRPEYVIFRKRSVSLTVNKFFLGKTAVPGQPLKKIELHSFYDPPRSELEHKWNLVCPVRALRIYLEKTDSIRKDNQLFISYSRKFLGRKVSTQSLSRWICKCIVYCYELMGKPVPSEVTGHSTRAVGASLADMAGVSIDQLCRAADWKSGYVFAKYYRMDTSYSSASLSTSILSQVLPKDT